MKICLTLLCTLVQFVAICQTKELIPYLNAKGKYGFCTPDKKIVIPCMYDDVIYPEPGQSVLQVKQGAAWLLIDKTGKALTTAKYTDMQPFAEGWASVFDPTGLKYNFINSQGKSISKERYDATDFKFSEGFTYVMTFDEYEGYAYFFLDAKDNKPKWQGVENYFIVPIKESFDNYVKSFKNGSAYIRNVGYINRNGKLLVKDQFTRADSFDHYFRAIVGSKTARKLGVIDTTGKFIIPAEYDFIYSKGLGFYEARKETPSKVDVSLFDVNGNKTFSISFNPASETLWLDYFNKDTILYMSKGEKKGTSKSIIFIDNTGKQVIPGTYTKASSFAEGKAIVSTKEGKTNIINRSGQTLATVDSLSAESFQGFVNGFAILSNPGDKPDYLINEKGKIVMTAKFITYDYIKNVPRYWMQDASDKKKYFLPGKFIYAEK